MTTSERGQSIQSRLLDGAAWFFDTLSGICDPTPEELQASLRQTFGPCPSCSESGHRWAVLAVVACHPERDVDQALTDASRLVEERAWAELVRRFDEDEGREISNWLWYVIACPSEGGRVLEIEDPFDFHLLGGVRARIPIEPADTRVLHQLELEWHELGD
ncbi:MAG: hypothetical protein AAF533_00755 [Acidobacteriota bacterium]